MWLQHFLMKKYFMLKKKYLFQVFSVSVQHVWKGRVKSGLPAVVGGACSTTTTWGVHVLLRDERLKVFFFVCGMNRVCGHAIPPWRPLLIWSCLSNRLENNQPRLNLYLVQPHKHPKLLLFGLGVGRRGPQRENIHGTKIKEKQTAISHRDCRYYCDYWKKTAVQLKFVPRRESLTFVFSFTLGTSLFRRRFAENVCSPECFFRL